MNEENNTVVETVEETVSFTDAQMEQIQKMIQSESDRRTNQALEKQRQKFEKQMSEAEKLRTMDESARETYKLEQRIKELEELNSAYMLSENKATLAKALSERGLPITFVDYLVAQDADAMMNNVNEFEKAWKAAINDAITVQLKGSSKPNGASVSQTGLTKEQFKKMSMAQQAELYNTNKTLYMELSKR